MISQKTESSPIPSRVVWLSLVLLGILSLLFIPVPSPTFFWKAVNNSGHAPLFAVVSFLLLMVSRIVLRSFDWPSIRHYMIAIFGVVVLALATEALQMLSPTRQPQVSDFVYDLVGALCGLGLSLTFDHSVQGKWAQVRTPPRNIIVRIGIALVIAMMFLPVAEWAYAYWDRASRFPSLLQFSSDWEMKFVMASGSDLTVVSPPEEWEKPVDDLVGHVRFYPKPWPGIRIDEPYPDWRGYTYFQLDIYSELSNSRVLSIRIDDAHHNKTYEDRFTRRITISPGFNHIQIPLDEIRQAPVGREMDLSAIKMVLVFAKSPPEEFSLYIDNIRLE